jgi:hypothetical protein
MAEWPCAHDTAAASAGMLASAMPAAVSTAWAAKAANVSLATPLNAHAAASADSRSSVATAGEGSIANSGSSPRCKRAGSRMSSGAAAAADVKPCAAATKPVASGPASTGTTMSPTLHSSAGRRE